jgi:hypothetical protein
MKATFSAWVALLAAGILWAGFCSPRVARAASIYVPFNGEKTTWHDGFDRYDYLMDEASFAITPFKRPDSEKFAVGNPPKGQRRCIVVVPKQAAPGHPWSWQGHIVVPPLTAQSGAVRMQLNAAYQLMTEHGLSSRQIQFVANFDFEVIFDISTVRGSSVQPHPQATPTGCAVAGLAGFFPDSARMISRMNSTASWAFLCANSIPTVSPFTTGNWWQSS